MVFVALFMKNWYLKIVEAEHPVWALSETKQLYGHIVKEYKDCVPEKRPADTFNRPSKIYEKLYTHTWDYRWQYAVMTAINDFINVTRGREQESTKEKWIAYLEKAVQVHDEYVKNPVDVHELWVFRPYENQIAFVADLMKNIDSKNVNVVNTPFDLFGLHKTNLLYNMIMVLCVRDQLGQFKDHSLDNRWKWAVMKVILHDSESRKTEKFRHKALNDWFEYLNAAYTHANRVPDEFQKFSPYEKEIQFVSECMKNMSDEYRHASKSDSDLKEVEQLIDTLYNKMKHEFYDKLLKETQKLLKDGSGNDEIVDNFTLNYTWQYALMRTINIISHHPDEIAHWVSILQKAYQIAHPSAILATPAKAAGPGPAGGNGGPTAPAKVAEPVVEAPPAVDESPIQENEEFQKFKPCKKEMIFVADVMKKIHEKKVGVENLALFGKAKTNVLYDLITRLYSDEVAENLPQTSILYTHPLDYRWQFVLMKAINYQVGLREASSEEWITYLKDSYEYTNRTSREFSMFIRYKEKVVFVADFMKRMSVTKPKDDDPVLKLALTQQLFDRIQKKYKKLLVDEKGVNTDTLEYTWQYALIETMNELGRMFPEDNLFKKPSLLKYLDEAYNLSHPSATPTPASEVPKLPLPSVSPAPSESSEDDVKSDAEESDADGAGQDIGTAPGTPADTNFTPGSTPPPDQKAGGGRPQSAPSGGRNMRAKGKTAEEVRDNRIRGAVTSRGDRRGELYDSLRKQEGKDDPAADAAPVDGGAAGAKSTSKKRSSEESAESAETLDLASTRYVKLKPTTTSVLAVAVVKENTSVEPVARAGGRTIQVPPSPREKNPTGSNIINIQRERAHLYRAASFWKQYQRKIKALAAHVRELMQLTPDELKRKLANMDELMVVICIYFHDCLHNPVYKKYLKDNFSSSVRYEFMLIDLMGGALNTKNGEDGTLHWISVDEWVTFLKAYKDIKPSEQKIIDRINAAVDKYLEDSKRQQVVKERNEETRNELPDAGGKKKIRSTSRTEIKGEKRKDLYAELKAVKWSEFTEQITTLAAFITAKLNEADRTGNNNLISQDNKPLYVVYTYVSTLLSQITQNSEVQNESYVIDAMNNDVDTIENQSPGYETCVPLSEWKEFLRKIPRTVTDIQKLRSLTLESELHTFPADVSPLIHNLTRRLEALQDW
jgi:hypothetical protein